MGMGMIGYALSGAGQGLGQGMAQVGMEEMKQMMEQNRQARLLEMKNEQEIAGEQRMQGYKLEDERRKLDLAESERQRQTGMINDEAQRIATGKNRISTPDEVGAQADQAAMAYNDALSKQLISQEDANAGYRAAEQYREDNSTPNAKPTLRDVAEARVGLGYDKPADLLKLDSSSEDHRLSRERLDRIDAIDADYKRARIDSTEALADKRRYDAEHTGGGKPLTPVQKARNYEIDAARKRVEGMSPDEIKRKTQQYTATGRENPDFDPQLAVRARLAFRRKVGDDPWFDQALGGGADVDTLSGANAPRGNMDILKDFRSDPAMRGKGYKFGKRTEEGFEILDSTGKLIGHYR